MNKKDEERLNKYVPEQYRSTGTGEISEKTYKSKDEERLERYVPSEYRNAQRQAAQNAQPVRPVSANTQNAQPAQPAAQRTQYADLLQRYVQDKQQEMQQSYTRDQREKTGLSAAQFMQDAALRQTYGTYGNYLNGVAVRQTGKPEELQQFEAITAAKKQEAQAADAQRRAQEQKNQRAKELSQGELNRSTAMQQEWGTYENYLNGVKPDREAATKRQELIDSHGGLANVINRFGSVEELENVTQRLENAGGNTRITQGPKAREREIERYEKATAKYQRVKELEQQKAALDEQIAGASWYQKLLMQAQAAELERQIGEARTEAAAASADLNRKTSVRQFAQDAGSALVKGGALSWAEGMATVAGFIAKGATGVAAALLRSYANDPTVTPDEQTRQATLRQAEKLEGTDYLANANALQDAYRGVMELATHGRGKVGKWVMEQMPSAGAMLMDMGVSAGAGMIAGGVQTAGSAAAQRTAKTALGRTAQNVGRRVSGNLAVMGTRAAGNAALQAKNRGATDAQAVLIGMENGATEVFSEMLFGGNPVYDTDAGIINQLVSRVTKNRTILKILDGMGAGGRIFNLAEEGIEEVVAELLEPTFEQLVLEGSVRGATSAKELGSAFLGGVFLSVLGNVVGARGNVQNARYEKAVRSVSQEIIEQAANVQNEQVQQAVQELQDKLDYGRTPDAADIGRVIQAMDDAGVTVDAERAREAAQTGTQEAILDFIEENGNRVTMQQISDFSEEAGRSPQDQSVLEAFTALEDRGVIEYDEDGSVSIREEYRNGREADLTDSGERYADDGTGRQAGQVAGRTGQDFSGQYGPDAGGEGLGGTNGTESVRTGSVTEERRGEGTAPYGEREGLRRGEGTAPYGENEDVRRGEGTAPYGEREDLRRGEGTAPYGKSEDLRRGEGTAPYGENEDGRRGEGTAPYGQSVDERVETANWYREQVIRLGIQPKSPQELGLASGVKEATTYELPERLWGTDVKEAAQAVRDAGCSFRAVLGAMPMKNGKAVDAFYDPNTNTVTVRADGLIRDARRLGRHELYHRLSDEDSSLNQTVRRQIRKRFSMQEYRSILEQYVLAARGIYDELSDDRIEDVAEEELLADAYAGMNRFADADATRYTQTVNRTVQKRTNRQTAEATEDRTGPPQRYSISETEDGRAVAVVDSDILSSIDTTNWNEAKKEQAKAAAKTALLAFKDGVQVNGIDYKVNKKSRDEYTRSNDTDRTYRKNKSAFADKMRAAANVGDIITATTDWAKDGRLKHPRTDNIKDFLHGEILIQSGENRYEAKTVIGITDQNQYVFYDVVDMTPIDFKMKEEPSSAASGKNAVSAILEGPSKNNIADEEEEVKQRFSESEETDSRGEKLTAAQQSFFKESKIRDENGKLLVVYHGSPRQFTEFSAQFMSEHGSSEGQGFYFTDSKSMAQGYEKTGGQLLEGYLDIKKPLSDSDVTLTRAQVKRLLMNIDPTGDDVILNYDSKGGMGYPSKAWYSRSLNDAVNMIYDASDSDSEILAEIANAGAGTEKTVRTVRDTFGYDGYIIKGKYDGANVYVAFESNQFKNTDNLNPTENQDIRYSESEDETVRQQQEQQAQQERKTEKLPRYVKTAAEDLRTDVMEAIGADTFHDMRAVQDAAERMAREAYETGEISEEARKAALDVMLDNARTIDSELFDDYEEVRDDLRKRRIFIPEDVRSAIPDFENIRRRNANRVGMSYTTGRGIDQAYESLREIAPELFPESISNLTDQLERIIEVREMLDRAEQDSADMMSDEHVRYVEEQFRVLADGMEAEMRNARRNEETKQDERRREEAARLAREGFDGRQAEAKALLGILDDEEEIGVLDVGDIDPAWTIKNTRQMQDLYRQYAASVPENRRLDEGLYWYMKQKVANGDMAQRKKAISTLQAMQQVQDFTRDGFNGTEALDRIGVKVARSVTTYENTAQMIARDKAAKQTRRMVRKAERELGATDKEIAFAEGIASGVMSARDIPDTVNRRTVIELADYKLAAWNAGEDMIRQRRQDIRDNLQEVMGGLFDELDDNTAEKVRNQSALRLNYNTTQRNAIRLFGDELGTRINKIIFDPVNQNESERIRWLNRQIDDVREFEGQDGRKHKLTDEQSALVQQVIEGYSVSEMVAGDTMAMSIRAAADEINEGRDAGDAAIAWGLGSEQRQLAVKYAQWVRTNEALQDADTVLIGNAVKAYQQKFNEFYAAINDFLAAHGFETIGFIRNYAPHMQAEQDQTLLTKALQAMGIDTAVTELPTSIAGLTGDWKPNRRWNPYFLSRTTDVTTFDIQSAYQSYVQYLSDVLYHTDDIMTMRSMVSYFRDRFAPEEIRNEIDRIQELRHADHDRKREFLRSVGKLSMDSLPSAEDIDRAMQEELDRLYKDASEKNLFGNYVVYLENYANILAGKQSIADRGTEQLMGRKILNAGRNLVNTFAKSQVAANLSSMLNQSAQLANVIGDKGAVQTARAFADIVTGKCKKADFAQRSDFLTAKKGVDFLVTDKKQMIVSALFTPAEFADRLMSTLAVRAAYNEALGKGMSDKEAMLYADRYGRKVMGDRSKGGRAVAFASKNPVLQMVNVFQIEALNTWQHAAQDTLGSDFRQIERESGRKAAARAVAGVIVRTILSAFILNRLGEELYGGTPAPFDFIGLSANFIASGNGLDTNEWIRTVIDSGMEKLTGERVFDTEEADEEFDFWAGLEDLSYNVTNDIPFVRNVAGLMGWGDETLPIPNIGEWVGDVKKDVQEGMTWEDAGENAFDLITMLAPGGRQLQKTAKGIRALAQGGDYTASGKLKYSIDPRDPLTFIKALAFGPNALTESRQYWAEGGKYLSDSQTVKFNQLREEGYDREMLYDLIQDMKKVNAEDDMTSTERGAAIRDLFSELDIPDENKVELYNRLNFDEGDTKPEKLNAMLETSMSWEQIKSSYNKYQELYNEDELDNSQKATEMSMFLDKLGLEADQKEAAKDGFKFYNMVPAEAGKYEKLTETGMDEDTAYEMTLLLSGLEPMEGKDQVTDKQKYEAILKSDFEESDKESALRTVINAKTVDKIDVLSNFGVSCEVYAKFKVKWEEKYSGESVSQEKVKNIIDSMGLTNNAQKAALFQLTAHPSKKKDGSINNPYSETSGLKAWELIDDMPDE